MRKAVSVLLAIIFAAAVLHACRTTESVGRSKSEHEKFIEAEKGQGELFRVLYMSDTYKVKQMWADGSIVRNQDPGGDSYMCNELKKHDKFEEVKESVISVWLYPDSGALMKIRPKEPTFLFEIDKLILEDIQRWTFKFPKKTVVPSKFDVRYRVVIRKTLSDQEILKDLQESLKEKSQY